MSEAALMLADDLENINKPKGIWQFEDAAKHIREMAAKIKELQARLDEMEKSK